MTSPKPGPRVNYAAIEDGSSASPKPSTRASLVHAQILSELLDNKQRRLAGNVSDENVDRAATRWIP